MVEDALRARLRAETLEFQLIDGGDGRLQLPARDRQGPRSAARSGGRFSGACIELALSSYAGLFATTPPQGETEYAVYWPTLVPADMVEEVVTAPDGERIAIAQTRGGEGAPIEPPARRRRGSGRPDAAGAARARRRRPLGRQGR